ncbi:MAG: CoA transferase [Hydrocarboniphaga sp.]|uniref:CaiB/BaiF CoA transferase family protein n=1 Tax=Hydrocarboniphaga sp. TaxID=2033016 RepID=UPI0026292E79|nr:CaiB/BaiF CoA-transferase family protein [Hydrocarboniphaga sp.]MDB5972464.1 CoA transferase [Hydrocarboniphaga sp.]
MPSIALKGVRVLDLSRVLAAPLATQLLADLGAEVIKVERPGSGDEARTYGPPFLHDLEGKATDIAAFYLACNRNKQSITINHAAPEGQALIRRLVAESDVLVENFKTGTLKKYGLDYDSLKAINPKLIYLSVTGFGQTGPYSHKPGYDGIFQAMGGLMSVSGHPQEPMKVGISMVDILTSFYAAVGILAALRHRDHSGEGQYIDLSLLDCGLASLSHFAMNYLVSGTVPTRRGNGGFGGIPSQAFQCSDKPIFIVAGNNKQFGSFCKLAGRLDIFEDPRFNTTAGRIANREQILPILDEVFKTKTRDEWLELLDANDIPASPVNELPEVFANPQIQHRGMLTQTEHPLSGALKLLANPINFSATPVGEYAAPPLMGAHTDQVLAAKLGLSAGDLAKLRASGVI